MVAYVWISGATRSKESLNAVISTGSDSKFRRRVDAPQLPAPHGETLLRNAGDPLNASDSSKYRCGTGKLLHMINWSRHDILNCVRELSCFMAFPTSAHMKRMYSVMNCTRDKENW
jgi:hypothetical protein